MDLGEFCKVVKVDLSWETAASQVYEIQVSDDAQTWTTVKTITDGAQGENREIVFNPVSARYVKVNCLKRATDWGNSLWEINIYHAADRDYFDGRNLAFRADASASSIENAGNAAASAVDGKMDTKWGSVWENITEEQKNNQWFMVDLGRDFLLDNVYLIWQSTAAYGKAYEEPEEEEPVDPVDPVDPVKMKFVDVPEDSWYYSYVEKAYEAGLMSGVSETEFAPQSRLSRGELMELLYQAAGRPETDSVAAFTDVQAEDAYFDAINWAVENNVAHGNAAGDKFSAQQSVTREQMIVFLFRYAAELGMDVSSQADLSGFKDAENISTYAETAMKWAVAEGILSGNSSKALKPKTAVSRAEAAKILVDFFHL